MIFDELTLPGVWRIGLEPHLDERGFFARTYCADEFSTHGLPPLFEQSSLSRNARKGTIRGMHYQREPHGEAKLVRCVRGSVFDVVIDLRPTSPTHKKWVGEHLSADNGLALYIPPGFAHGYQTMCDETDLLYQITPMFKSGLGAGVRWNDPTFNVVWPLLDVIISERDASYPDWKQ